MFPEQLACLDKKTGDKVWEHNSAYAWSSPVCVYTKDGTGKVLYCTSAGDMHLLDGVTGEVHDTLSISEGVIQASPAVYGSYGGSRHQGLQNLGDPVTIITIMAYTKTNCFFINSVL